MTERSGVIAASLIAAALALAACGRSSPDSRTGPDTAPTGQDTVSNTGPGGSGAADSSTVQQGASSATTPPPGWQPAELAIDAMLKPFPTKWTPVRRS